MSAEEQDPVDRRDLVTVRIVDLPVGLHVRATEHSEGLRREFQLLHEYTEQTGTATVPRRLLDLVNVLRANYGGFTTAQEDELEAAVVSGTDRLTLTFRVPRDAADAARALGGMLDEADDFCREGQHLLTLAAPDDVVTYRRWYLSQFVDQISGAPPTPWDHHRTA